MQEEWQEHVQRWQNAGVIDADTVQRIRQYESGQPSMARLRWPARVALAFGGLTMSVGLLLWIGAQWERVPPLGRVLLLVSMVSGLHIAARRVRLTQYVLSVVLHAVASIGLGPALYLLFQTFSVPSFSTLGLLLWCLGAWAGWLLLRQWPQLALAAVLSPIWLTSQWLDSAKDYRLGGRADQIAVVSLLHLTLVYFTARTLERDTVERRILTWIGGVTLLPFLLLTWFNEPWRDAAYPLLLPAWIVAFGLPLCVAWALHRQRMRHNALAAVWVGCFVLITSQRWEGLAYLWTALGGTGLLAWGVREQRPERINLGVAIFGLTLLLFYFSSIMGRLERSFSLLLLGALLLGGGWLLERLRRKVLENTSQ